MLCVVRRLAAVVRKSKRNGLWKGEARSRGSKQQAKRGVVCIDPACFASTMLTLTELKCY